jgi:hypothetical protein
MLRFWKKQKIKVKNALHTGRFLNKNFAKESCERIPKKSERISIEFLNRIRIIKIEKNL